MSGDISLLCVVFHGRVVTVLRSAFCTAAAFASKTVINCYNLVHSRTFVSAALSLPCLCAICASAWWFHLCKLCVNIAAATKCARASAVRLLHSCQYVVHRCYIHTCITLYYKIFECFKQIKHATYHKRLKRVNANMICRQIALLSSDMNTHSSEAQRFVQVSQLASNSGRERVFIKYQNAGTKQRPSQAQHICIMALFPCVVQTDCVARRQTYIHIV